MRRGVNPENPPQAIVDLDRAAPAGERGDVAIVSGMFCGIKMAQAVPWQENSLPVRWRSIQWAIERMRKRAERMTT